MDMLEKNFESIRGGKYGFAFIRVDILAKKIGTSEVLLRFFIGVFLGYPLSWVYLRLFPHQQKQVQQQQQDGQVHDQQQKQLQQQQQQQQQIIVFRKHVFFTAVGLFLNYFTFGTDCLFNVFSIVVAYTTLQICGGTTKSVIFAFVFQTSYLMLGYVVNASDGYDIKWTTPQCVLCLRLIAITWNVFDGAQKEEALSPDQKNLMLKQAPTLLELFAYSYCFCGFLSGLQYSYKRYRDFVYDELIDDSVVHLRSSRFAPCLKRLVGSVTVLLLFQTLDPHYKTESLLTNEFLERGFLEKVVGQALVYYIQYMKYVIVWWLGESVAISLGMSYNGVEEGAAVVKWNGTCNFSFTRFVLGPFYQDIVTGFNILTNEWSGRYVFRRLRFLGSKPLSHFLTLTYLAVWHGFYVGYFIMFFIEFVYVMWERHYCAVLRKFFNITYLELPLRIRIPVQIAGLLFKILTCGFAAMPFLLLRWRKIRVLFATVYYWPVFVIMIWFVVVYPILSMVIKSRKLKEKAEVKKED